MLGSDMTGGLTTWSPERAFKQFLGLYHAARIPWLSKAKSLTSRARTN